LVIGGISDPQNIDSVPAEPITEIPIGMRKLGGDKNKVHGIFSSLSGMKLGRMYLASLRSLLFFKPTYFIGYRDYKPVRKRCQPTF
jgi:hypothetical protein